MSAGFALLANLKVLANYVAAYFRVGAGGSMFGASLSLALVGVGHLIGMTVGIAMLVGLVISFGVLLPIRTIGTFGADESVADVIDGVFTHEVRFIGAGAIAVAAVLDAAEDPAPDHQRHPGSADVRTRPPPGSAGRHYPARHPVPHRRGHYRGDAAADRCAAVGVQSRHRAAGQLGRDHRGQRGFRLFIGLVIAAVCGYMAGLIGSSNSPISGLAGS